MKPTMPDLNSSLSRSLSWLAVVAPLLLAAPGCANPKQDKFQNQGGIAADPGGIMRGSVIYLGPHPACEYKRGKPTRVLGRVILSLFRHDNPPPPEGRATSALNLLTISGAKLFTLTDCLADGDAADPEDTLTRSVAFEWPTISLVAGRPMEYQVRGFYDSDEDMNPFFSVKRLPTAGDVVGAALNDATNASKGLARLAFPAREDAPNGFVRHGVTVTLGRYVWTELPAFQLSPTHRALSAEAAIRPVLDTSVSPPTVSVPGTVRAIWNMTCGDRAKAATCGLSLQALKQADVARTLAEAGVQLDFSPERYAFFVQPVDLKTIKAGAPDVSKPDGMPDPHPLLGASLGVTWSTPIVLFTRVARGKAEGAIEAQAGVPGVTLVGSVLPDAVATQRTFVGKLDIAVPPLAVVDLDPTQSACRVPYAAPGNLTRTFEDQIAQCGDLPTGVYAANVLHGVAGGTRVKEPDPAISQNGFVIQGGSPAGQAWSVPNELAVPVQVGDGFVLKSQGPEGLFIVHDPAPTKTGDCTVAPDPALAFKERKVAFRSVCEAGDAPLHENAAGVDSLGCLPTACCDGVKHLCGVALCPFEKVGNLNVRRSPTKIVAQGDHGRGIPDCVPFAIPDLCCAGR